MNDAAICIKGLKKSFKDKEVLKGVDLEVVRGEIFALLGSNGAGKTTIVNILSTLMKQDCGEVSICSFRRHANRAGKSDDDCQVAWGFKSLSSRR